MITAHYTNEIIAIIIFTNLQTQYTVQSSQRSIILFMGTAELLIFRAYSLEKSDILAIISFMSFNYLLTKTISIGPAIEAEQFCSYWKSSVPGGSCG